MRGLLATVAQLRARREADAWLRISNGRSSSTGPFAWRATQLTSAGERRLLARSLQGVLRDIAGNRLPGSAPLNRAELRPFAAELRALAERLADLERPVSPRGVLLVHDLLTDGGGPLYLCGNAGELPDLLAQIHGALEVH